MKQHTFSFLLILIIAASAGCQQQEEFGSMDRSMAVVTAIIDCGNNTKTMLGAPKNGVYYPLWKENDQVAVFAGDNGSAERYTLQSGAGTDTATFHGLETGYPIVSLYPYSSITEDGYSDNVLTLELPAVQQYCKGSFGEGAYPMLAVSQTSYLTFMNLCAVLRLSLTGTGSVEYIRFKAHDAQMSVSGLATVRTDFDTSPELVMKSGGSNMVTLNCGGVNLSRYNPTDFFLVIPAGTYKGGFELEISSVWGKEVLSVETDITFERSQYRSVHTSVPTSAYYSSYIVDLGLTSGLKWASCNLGAISPEQNGDGYAWGETTPKTDYSWETYKFWIGTEEELDAPIFSKYGDVDNKTILEIEDDSAYVNLGGNWHIPTHADWEELWRECTWTGITLNGVDGCVITGHNGKSIFLPNGDYWSSSFSSFGGFSDLAVSASVWGDFWIDDSDRCSGHLVRPVSYEDERILVTGISLDYEEIDLNVGERVTLTATVSPTNAPQIAVWSSSNIGVAKVDNNGMVTAVAPGTATITVTTYRGLAASCIVTVNYFLTPTGSINGYGYVDLGLPSGLKWATCNVGASAPEEYGDYFAWGDPEPNYTSQDPLTWRGNKTGYNWASLKWCNGSSSTLTKYNTDNSRGTVDNNTVLDPDDDAASVNWESNWRMPTNSEWEELIKECSWSWTTQNGVNGYLVTSKNSSNSIFLPAAGHQNDTRLYFTKSDGYYWSSSLRTDLPYTALGVHFISRAVLRDWGYCYHDRYLGFSVRPVTE